MLFLYSLNSSWFCLIIETVGFIFLSRGKFYIKYNQEEGGLLVCASHSNTHESLINC